MKNKIDWNRKAIKQLSRIAMPSRERISQAVDTLEDMATAKNVKALKSHKYGYRLRVGDYRILFDWQEAVHIINIEEVKKRDGRTY